MVFCASVVTAVGATYGVYRVLETVRAEGRTATRPVVVATADVAEGSGLDGAVLTVASWPAAAVPTGAYASLDSVVGRVARVAVFKGEPIVPGRLAPKGTGPGIEVKIAPGKRAMAVKIDDVAGISGLVQPNSRVDVLVTLNDGVDGARPVAKLFMGNMRVLSVGTQVQRGSDERPIAAQTATLEVTPEEAERLAVATREGSIQLVLRGYGDPESVKTNGARSRDVLAQLSSAAGTPAGGPAARRVRGRGAQPGLPAAATAEPGVAAAPEPARSRDSLTVLVFRGERVTQQKVEKSDDGAAPPAAVEATAAVAASVAPTPER